MKSLLFSLFITIVSTAAFAQAPTPGTALPSAVFYKADGAAFSTDQIPKGKKALLMLFDATCEHCQRVAKNMAKRSAELNNINIYMISMDEFRSINYFMDNFAKPLKTMKNIIVFQDRDRVFVPLFHPKQYPSLYLYGPDRKLIYYSSNENDVPKFFKLIKP